MLFHVSNEVFAFLSEIDECLSDPCQNGGTCLNDAGGYMCQCLDGFTGSLCHSGKNKTLTSDLFPDIHVF